MKKWHVDSKKAGRVNLLISLLFAGIMLVSSLLIEDHELSKTVRFILISVWMVLFLYLARKATQK